MEKGLQRDSITMKQRGRRDRKRPRWSAWGFRDQQGSAISTPLPHAPLLASAFCASSHGSAVTSAHAQRRRLGVCVCCAHTARGFPLISDDDDEEEKEDGYWDDEKEDGYWDDEEEEKEDGHCDDDDDDEAAARLLR